MNMICKYIFHDHNQEIRSDIIIILHYYALLWYATHTHPDPSIICLIESVSVCCVCERLRGNCSALGWRGWEAVVSNTWGSCLPAQLVNDFTGRAFALRHLLRKQLSNRFWRHHNATSNDLEQIQVGFRYKQANIKWKQFQATLVWHFRCQMFSEWRKKTV